MGLDRSASRGRSVSRSGSMRYDYEAVPTFEEGIGRESEERAPEREGERSP